MFQETSIPEGSSLATYVGLLEDGFCPYLQSSRENGTLYFSHYDIRRQEPEATRARLFLLGLIHTEWLRHKRGAARSIDQALLTCENLIVDVDANTDGPSLFGWPHFILKAVYTESGVLFGKFWRGEATNAIDGRPVPVPPLHILSIRSAVKKKDHRFFERVMSGMRPEFDRGRDHGESPLRSVAWLTTGTTDRILAVVASEPGRDEIVTLVNELVDAGVYQMAKRWAEQRLKEIKRMESAIQSARTLGQLLPKLVERVGTELTCMQQVTDRRGAAVWRVDTTGAGSFALKYVTPGDAGPHDPAVLVRHEGAVLSAIGSPAGGIFVDAGEIDGTPFLMTRWLDAAVSSNELAKQLRQKGNEADLAKLVLVAQRIVESIARVHEAGWVHGDVQPSHFMVDAETRVHLLDWALARRADRSDGYKHGGCFVHYAAPEIAVSMLRGDSETGYDQPAEIYALSATLLNLLTGLVAVDYGDEPKEAGPERLRHRLERASSGKHVRSVGTQWATTPVGKAIHAGLRPAPGDRPTAAGLLSLIRGE